jgi:protein gp37
MTLGRTRIEWARCPDGKGAFVWNPVSGCRNGCPYCWARSMVKRFPATYPNGFEPTASPRGYSAPFPMRRATVLTCIMGDLFSDGVRSEWQDNVALRILFADWITFLLLTKRPDAIRPALFAHLPNLWLGTSVESGAVEHYRRIGQLRRVAVAHRFVSFEPIMDSCDLVPGNFAGISWAIIGAMTGPGAKPPKRAWVDNIIWAATRAGVPLFLKDNLLAHFPDLNRPEYRALPYLSEPRSGA